MDGGEDMVLTGRGVLAFGGALVGRVELQDAVSSTQEVVRELAGEGAQGGTLVVARRQVGGKGRRGRVWGSPEGGLWMSLLLRPEFAPHLAPRTTQCASVAVARALISFGIEARIKWPNDILVGGRKISGVLAESSMMTGADEPRLGFVALGIGLNVNLDPQDLGLTEYDAASVRGELGRDVPLLEVLSRVIPALESELGEIENFRETLAHLRDLSDTLGRRVRVRRLGEIVEGRAVDINPDGALTLETANGNISLYEGDVENLRGI